MTSLPYLIYTLFHTLPLHRYTPKTTNHFRNEYDYIIVGAGSAGSVVASRLSEEKCVTVLLLEVGNTPTILTEIPILSSEWVGSNLDWKFKSVPQRHCASALTNRQIMIPSGKAIGGTSVINDMLSIRGNRHNYDEWAAMGAKGWSYDEVLPYFKKLEDYRNRHSADAYYHGFKGPITVSKPGYNSKLKKFLTEAVVSEGYQFVDPNGRRQHGFYDPEGTIRDGRRCSTAKAYLVPSDNRTNLDIVPKAMVTKIDIQNKQAVGVYFQYKGSKHYVKARKEIIVSAGAYNTPKLLMLSGIGPKTELDRFNIPLISNLPVGHNLQDHIGGFMLFELNNEIPTLLSQIINKDSIEQYVIYRTGIWSSFHALELLAFLHSNKNAEANDYVNQEIYFGNVPGIFALQRGATQEAFFSVFAPYLNKTLMLCMPQLVDPKSRGYVRLVSTNPADLPEINPNYFENPEDSKVVVEGFRTCMKITKNAAFAKLQPKLVNPNYPSCQKYSHDTDKYYDCAARAFPIASSHHVGTAKMGDPNDESTVLDYKLRVKTVKGLRVVDASVMPTIPWGNTNIPTIMIAEKASDMIRKTIKCSA